MRSLVILACALVMVNEAIAHKVKPLDSRSHDKSEEHKLEGEENILPEDHRFFLQEIFDKYGSHGVMSFEGFEHLLENLGLGRLSFEKSHSVSVHRVNGTFHEVHDKLELHRHNHEGSGFDAHADGRAKRALSDQDADYEPALEQLVLEHDEDSPGIRTVQAISTGRCLSPQDILATYGLEPHHDVAISPVGFLHLCPAIVYELDQRSCYDHGAIPSLSDVRSRPNKSTAWLYATLSILAISLTGLLGVAVVPLIQRAFYQQLLHFLVALAVGTLCGDALLHLLPHALVSTPGTDDHTIPVLRASTTFVAVAFFFLLEAIIRLIRSANDTKKEDLENDGPRIEHVVEMGPMLNKLQPANTHGHGHGHHHHQQPSADLPVSSIAWMIIMGDGLHNLTDGLAIGAAFAGDTVAGFATTLAVFCHELPHELGDFAVLLKSGMSIRKALFYNVFSSILSFIGMAVGVWVGEHEETTLWIYAATAGIFLYIGLSDLVPEMSNNLEGSRSVLDLLLQLAGIMTGGGIMLAIALYEEDLRSIFN